MSSSSIPFIPRTAPFAASAVVVDDVPEIQNLLQQWLRELGCVATCVSSGNDAIRILRTMHVDLVITDVIMPEGDGLDVITEMKRIQPTARILAISGGGAYIESSECLKWARGLGADAGLRKPFKREQFLDAAAPLLARTDTAAST